MFGLSTLGALHTLISLIAVIAALVMFAMRGRITPHGTLGITYLVCTTLGCVSALGLSKHGGFNPGHVLALLTILCLIGAVVAEKRSFRAWPYIQVGLLSTSLFFSLVPAVNETLTRLPLASPLATGPTDPLVQKSLGALTIVFVFTLVAQFVFIRQQQRQKARL